MAWSGDPDGIYSALGVKRIITASGSTTAYGGSKTRPEIHEAMNKASRMMVSLDDLNRAASRIIADATGAEAGFVSSGAAGGLVLQAAAVIAGSDPAMMDRLPDSTGMKNEIIIHKSHRFPYDQCYTSVGAKFVEIGDGRRCQPWQLGGGVHREHGCGRVPVFAVHHTAGDSLRAGVRDSAQPRRAGDSGRCVDAAAALEPATVHGRGRGHGDIQRRQGGAGAAGDRHPVRARGPDRRSVRERRAAPVHRARHEGRQRGDCRTAAAIQIFVDEDEEAEMARYTSMARQVVDAFAEVEGLRVTLEHDEFNYLIPHAVMRFTREWHGPGRNEVYEMMKAGDPPVYMHDIFDPDELAVDPLNLDEEELEIVIRRLSEVLLG